MYALGWKQVFLFTPESLRDKACCQKKSVAMLSDTYLASSEMTHLPLGHNFIGVGTYC